MSSLSARVLLVDDDPEMHFFLRRVLAREDYEMITCSSGLEALNHLKSQEPGKTPSDQPFDIIICDVQMPHVDGVAIVERVKNMGIRTPVILMTAYGSIPSAVDAIKKGAHDYLAKPIQINDLRETLKRTIEYKRMMGPQPFNTEHVGDGVFDDNLIGENSKMQEIFALIRRIAKVDSTVLILGESGTGKEVIAQAIHKASTRHNKSFMAINCAAIPEELLESELFGHAKGSFTGAVGPKRGLFEEAEGGTIFLDEIGDMPPSLQAKLLRVLQERKIRPVGSNIMKDLDVRIIAATHRDLRTAMVDGEFREDLYYRLSVVPIVIPPLRERLEDIPLLACHFLKKIMGQSDGAAKRFGERTLDRLRSHPWKGNVRELENAIERAVVLSRGYVIEAEDFSFLQNFDPPVSTFVGTAERSSLALRDIEREALVLALQKSGGRKEEAARLLGISRKTLYRKEREYGLVPRTTPAPSLPRPPSIMPP